MNPSITHIINPVKVPLTSDLFEAQPITFQSMIEARETAMMKYPDAEIQLLSCCYPEDHKISPQGFELTDFLEFSIRSIEGFDKSKKLPFIQEIMARAFEHSKAQWIIYSNVDIGLYKDFYIEIIDLLSSGKVDSICINRMTLPNDTFSLDTLGEIHSVHGIPHEGIDCFVFPREWIPKMVFGQSIIGSGPVGLIMATNMINLGPRTVWLRNNRLTFHIGDDKEWLKGDLNSNQLLHFCNEQLMKIIDHFLEQEIDSTQRTVMESIKLHLSHFAKNKSWLSRPYHREILAAYCDKEGAKVLPLFEAQVREVKKLNKQNSSGYNIWSRMLERLRKQKG